MSQEELIKQLSSSIHRSAVESKMSRKSPNHFLVAHYETVICTLAHTQLGIATEELREALETMKAKEGLIIP